MATLGITVEDTSNAFPDSTGRALVSRLTAPSSGSITTGQAYFSTSSTAGASFKIILLADNSGEPGAVLAVSNSATIPAGGGWVSATITADIVGNVPYWLGIVANDNSGVSSVGATYNSGNSRMANGTFSFSSPPSNWPGSDASYVFTINTNVTYTPSTGGGNSAASLTLTMGFDTF